MKRPRLPRPPRIAAYQVWNEANISTFWTGTPRQMAQLTKAMHDVRNRWRPGAQVVAPPMVARLPYQQDRDPEVLRDAARGRQARVALLRRRRAQPLPAADLRRLAQASPRTPSGMLHREAPACTARGPGSKPIWDTEINYGLQSGAKGGPRRGSDLRRPAGRQRRRGPTCSARPTASSGSFWYRYDCGRLRRPAAARGNTLLTDPDDATHVTAAGPRLRDGPGRGCTDAARDAARATVPCEGHATAPTRASSRTPRSPGGSTGTRSARRRCGSRQGARHRAGRARVRVRQVTGGSKLTVDYRPVMVYH